jgi:eukaryotic-like serine/threonine-protein kinase
MQTGQTIPAASWERLKDVLDEALSHSSPHVRAALVKRRCAGDPLLLREAESMLAQTQSLEREPSDWIENCADQATRTIWNDELSRVAERIGAYVVVREIGRGGMGAVYLADRADGQFEKQVAIKVLKRGTDTEDVLQRFATERRIIARLDHPNIARLLDAGTTADGLPYFVMEYVDGVPITTFVRGRQLSVGDRLRLFLKICGAVDVAHRAAVVHRDLKPRNILVTAHGEPKLLDFGIAKVLEPDSAPPEVTITARQHLTPAAASPEQVKGEIVTPASDVYALGALLFEMLTEQSPHQFPTAHPTREDVVRTVCEQEPVAPSAIKREVPGELDVIVLRAMRKEPSARYQSASELAADVESYLSAESLAPRQRSRRGRFAQAVPWRRVAVAAGVVALCGIAVAISIRRADQSTRPVTDATTRPELPAKSVAVLPFENLSNEPENAFFATGVQDAILTDLAKVADLKVLSRASVDQYANPKTRDIREISRALNVAHVVEGGVQRAGNRVRVTARLVDARTGEQKWAENYDRELADVFSIQSQIAQTIVRRLEANLLPREQAAIEVPPTRDAIAYDLYVRAREMVDSYTNAPDPKASLEQAIRLLTEARQRDPQFVVAWCYAARARMIITALGLAPDGSHAREAEAELERAVALNPELPEVHFAKAELFYRDGGRYEQAEREIALALPGMPNSAPLHTLAGNVWRRQARWHEAEQILIKAVELDPKNANAISFLADTQILMRRYTEAIATYERARAIGYDPVLFAVRVGIIEFMATGRSEPLRLALLRGPADLDIQGGDTPWRIMFALMDRDYDRAAAVLARSPRSTFQDVDLSFYYPRSWYEGVIARAAGRSDEARAAFRQVLADLNADDGRRRFTRTMTIIAQARAAVGETERAIELAERAAQTVGPGSNAYDAPLTEQGLAQVYTWTGHHDRALEIIERLVKLPGYLSYGHLLHDPAWEPLRAYPRFHAIAASIAPR